MYMYSNYNVLAISVCYKSCNLRYLFHNKKCVLRNVSKEILKRYTKIYKQEIITIYSDKTRMRTKLVNILIHI